MKFNCLPNEVVNIYIVVASFYLILNSNSFLPKLQVNISYRVRLTICWFFSPERFLSGFKCQVILRFLIMDFTCNVLWTSVFFHKLPFGWQNFYMLNPETYCMDVTNSCFNNLIKFFLKGFRTVFLLPK